MHHLLANYSSVNSSTPVQLNAVTDPGFTTNNNAFVLTESYNLVGAYASGAAIAAAQINSATINAINTLQIYPVNVHLAPASNPNVMDLRAAPQPLPMNEQIQAQSNNAAGGAEAELMLWWIKPAGAGAPDWQVMPGSVQNPRTLALFTTTITLTVGVWSPLATITFTNTLKGGIYQVNGAWLVVPNGTAFRFNFPIMPLYMGRKLFPGGLCEAAYGNNPMRFQPWWLGAWGRFNYFEPPQCQALGNATTSSTTYTGYMDITYMGPSGSDARAFIGA